MALRLTRRADHAGEQRRETTGTELSALATPQGSLDAVTRRNGAPGMAAREVATTQMVTPTSLGHGEDLAVHG